jgi:protoporphyrinogen oxidase
VADPNKVWIGLEYFCNETDPLWKLNDDEMAQLAVREVAKIGILNPEDVEDTHVGVPSEKGKNRTLRQKRAEGPGQ